MTPSARQELLQAAFDHLQEGVWLVDVHRRSILFSNAVAAALVGLPAAELVGEPVGRFAATPEDLCFWTESTDALWRGIDSQSQLLRADGALIPVGRRVSPCPAHLHERALLVTMSDRSAQQAVERELETLLSELRATLDSAADGMLVSSLQGQVRAFNQRLVQLWGIPQAQLVQRDDKALLETMCSQTRAPQAFRAHLAAMVARPHEEHRKVLELNNGLVLEWRSAPQWNHGVLVGRVDVFRDITLEMQSQAALHLAGRVFEASPYPIFVADAAHRLVRINAACERLMGLPASQLQGRTVVSLFQAGMASPFLESVRRDWAQAGLWSGDVWLHREADAGCAVHLSWVALPSVQGEAEQSIGFVRDLTQQHAAQKRIDELSYNDPLTSLPNRLLLTQRVETAIRTLRSTDPGFAVLLLDLDRFQYINDSLGHEFGDRVLQMVAQRLQICLRQSDMLCRTGGDEFAMYLHAGDVHVAEQVARRLLEVMQQPLELDGMHFSVQCSIGVALYPQDGRTLDDLVKQADTAMYQVKERGRGHFGFYQPQMGMQMVERMKLEQAMRQALDHGHMGVHFQPQVDMASGRIVGAEALLRWTDPVLGRVSPADFIPLAEETGYILTLGPWVLEQSVAQAARWMQAGLPIAVAVNISALEMRQSDFIARITGVLAAHGLPAHLLELELTESLLLQDAEEAAQILHRLAALGVTMAIDDFGTGYSSLAYLKNLPIHKLKIDQCFVRGVPGSQGDCAIVSAIVHLGRALQLRVVAEGVETATQRGALQAMDCDVYQGYLCSPALPADDFSVLLSESALRPQAG